MALRCFNGERLLPGMQPIATVYGGHQFGIYTSQLGDSRAILLGETRGLDGQKYEIQLKGAGLTPYSRALNGGCGLGSAIREYLAGEALAAPGIPSTRALGLLSGSTEIPGEGKAAILVRMARSLWRTVFRHRYRNFRRESDRQSPQQRLDPQKDRGPVFRRGQCPTGQR